MRTRTDTDYRSQVVTQTTTSPVTGQTTQTTSNRSSCSRAWRCEDVEHSRWKTNQAAGIFTYNPLEVATSRIEERAKYDADFRLENTLYSDGSGGWVVHGGFTSSLSPTLASTFLGNYTPLSDLVHSQNPNAYITRDKYHYGSVEVVKDEVMNRMLARMSDSDFMAAVAAAESGETAKMLNDAAGFMASLHTRFKPYSKQVLKTLRGLPNAEIRVLARTGPRALRSAAQTWLTARYGWMNLYRDLESFMNAKANTRTLRRLVEHGTHNYSGVPVHSDYQGYDNGHKTTYYVEDAVFGRSSSVTCGVMYRMNPTWASVDALGGRRLLSSIWELIPYSFVIDWVVGIGEKLAAVDSWLLSDTIGTWRTTTHNLVWSHSCSESPNWVATINWRGVGKYVKDVTRVDVCQHIIREANPAAPLLPSLSVRMNWKSVVDAASLLVVNSQKILALLRG